MKLLDVVALLEDYPQLRLRKGEVGTIVEEFDDGVVEVEFADKRGIAYAFADLPKSELLHLHTVEVAEPA
ncbi:MAG TPA: DUF4926 domain-containing protein [Candidatus Kapabacteria bacterium]